MWMNAAPLFPCVTSMPIVRTQLGLIAVPVRLDLVETGKRVLVRKKQDSKVYKISH